MGGGEEGRKQPGGGEREGASAQQGANLSQHSSLRLPKPRMLRTSIARAPSLPTSSGIFHLCLTFLLGQVGLLQGHPQCLDYGPPFQPLLHLEFCSDYESFGCCDQQKDHRLAARYRVIMDYLDLKGHELCGGYIKDILCQVGLSLTPQRSEGGRLSEVQGAGLGGVGPGWRAPWAPDICLSAWVH